jgi:hypothetical protein
MTTAIVLWGGAAGIFHFVLIGLLYGNPTVDRIYRSAQSGSPAMKTWSSKPRYLATQFLGTQVEVYLLTAAFFLLRPAVAIAGVVGALVLGTLLAAIRVYPRFWNMWVQTSYPNRLLAIEAVNGTIGTLAVALFLQVAAHP